MFKGIAEFAMLGRWHAAAMTALLSVVALVMPPINYLASGVISLTTLRMGPSEGAKVVTATIVVFALLAGFMGKLWVVGILLLIAWLPVFLVTLALGYTRSLAIGLMAASAVGVVGVVLMHLFIGVPAEWWFEKILPIIKIVGEQNEWSATQIQKIATQMAVWMTGIVAAGISLNAVLGLLIGRAWQSKLYQPGEFGREFRQLQLGKLAAVIALVPIILSFTPLAQTLSMIVDCMFVALLLFTIQGLSVIHAWVNARNKGRFLLIITYVLLVILMAQMMMILTIIGVLDQWFDFRKLSKSDASI
jgi:hypothetical protein